MLLIRQSYARQQTNVCIGKEKMPLSFFYAVGGPFPQPHKVFMGGVPPAPLLVAAAGSSTQAGGVRPLRERIPLPLRF